MNGKDICIDLTEGYRGDEIEESYGYRIASTLVSALAREGYRLGTGTSTHEVCFEDEKDAQDVMNALDDVGGFEPVVDKINKEL